MYINNNRYTKISLFFEQTYIPHTFYNMLNPKSLSLQPSNCELITKTELFLQFWLFLFSFIEIWRCLCLTDSRYGFSTLKYINWVWTKVHITFFGVSMVTGTHTNTQKVVCTLEPVFLYFDMWIWSRFCSSTLKFWVNLDFHLLIPF